MKLKSLAQLALEMGINKSQLAHWASLGVIVPVSTEGKRRMFDERHVKNMARTVRQERKADKKTLTEIAHGQSRRGIQDRKGA